MKHLDDSKDFPQETVARIHVQRGNLAEFPVADKVRGGWQNGIHFYPDAEVVKVIGNYIYQPDGADIAALTAQIAQLQADLNVARARVRGSNIDLQEVERERDELAATLEALKEEQ